MILGHLTACTVIQHNNGTQSITTHDVIPVHQMKEIPKIQEFIVEHIIPKQEDTQPAGKSMIFFMPVEKNFSNYAKDVDDLKGVGC